MASATGTAIIDFGAFPGSYEAAVNVTGQAAILATSKASAYVMGDDTTGYHSAEDHRWLQAFVTLSCGTPTAASGFTIYARSPQERMVGTYALRWVWTD
jgi:hypothetical protein